MSKRSPPPRDAARQEVLPGFGPSSDDVDEAGDQGEEIWIDRLREALAEWSLQARDIAEEALRAWPASPELLLLAALAALAGPPGTSGSFVLPAPRPRPSSHRAILRRR